MIGKGSRNLNDEAKSLGDYIEDYWERNGIKKPQAVVVCAACKHEDLILCGARHWDSVMNNQYNYLHDQPKAFLFEQGFINQFGEFLTREEAMIVALDAGQTVDIERGCGGNEKILFSEGLY